MAAGASRKSPMESMSASQAVARSRRRHRAGVSLAVNLAPMIDVTFLLMIFFLVTTTFERAEGLLTSRMPDESVAESVALPLTPIIVRLDADGSIAVGTNVSQLTERPDSFPELMEVLARYRGQPGFDKETPVVIVAGPDVAWDYVVNAWNAALGAGCKRVAFGEP